MAGLLEQIFNIPQLLSSTDHDTGMLWLCQMNLTHHQIFKCKYILFYALDWTEKKISLLQTQCAVLLFSLTQPLRM